MKIGIVCYPTHGGSGVVASELAMGLAKKGHEMHIVSYAPPFRLHTFHQNIFIHEVGVSSYPLFKYPHYALALATKLVELAEDFNLELIHAHYAVPHAVSAYLAKQVLNSHKIKTITTLHGTDITLVGAEKSFRRIIKFAIEESDGVTAVSNYLKKQTIKEFDIQTDIEVIYNFIDKNRSLPNDNTCKREVYAPEGEKLIMHTSNFRPVKRVADVVRIFAKIRQEISSKLILVGEGPDLLSVQQLVKDLNLIEHVLFLGAQDDTEPLYNCADLFLLPSEQESFGLTALEAMACGVPVIATEVGGLPEVIINGETGYLYALGDIDSMAERSVALLKDAKALELLKIQAKQRAFEFFDAEIMIKKYENFYEKIRCGK